MTAAQHGDRRAFDTLAAAYMPLLRGFLLHRVGAGPVDDVLQETLLAGWTALPGYSRRASFKAWLFAIAIRKCVDFYRMHGRRGIEVSLEEADGHLGAQKDWYAATDSKEAIRSVLALLPHEQREVVEMYYYAELSLPEIAHTLKRNLNTVKYQFYRAHTMVERALTEQTIKETIKETNKETIQETIKKTMAVDQKPQSQYADKQSGAMPHTKDSSKEETVREETVREETGREETGREEIGKDIKRKVTSNQ